MKGKKTGGLALNSRGYAAPTVRLRNLWKRPTEEEAVEKALSENPDQLSWILVYLAFPESRRPKH